MAQNISLLGATYSAVPAVTLPKSGGGTAMFIEETELANAGTATPLMDGTAAVGSSTSYSREDHVHPTDTSILGAIAPVLSSMVADRNMINGDYVIVSGNLFRVTTSVSTGDSLVQGTNVLHVVEGLGIQTKARNARRSSKKTFAKKQSEVSSGNNTYTAPNDGTFYLEYTFDNASYSQFGVKLNGNSIGSNITSGPTNLNGMRGYITIPMLKGDTLQVTFYSTFGMASITGYLFY